MLFLQPARYAKYLESELRSATAVCRQDAYERATRERLPSLVPEYDANAPTGELVAVFMVRVPASQQLQHLEQAVAFAVAELSAGASRERQTA